MLYTCPLCGLHQYFEDPADSMYHICQRCGWEDDGVEGGDDEGPNHMDLDAAREQWRILQLTFFTRDDLRSMEWMPERVLRELGLDDDDRRWGCFLH